jgi:acyl-ACP thioesterase
MSLAPAVEITPIPEHGRRFTARRAVRLGDVDASARMRFDALARFLQDVATDDADDAGMDGEFGWLVRRTMVSTVRSPRLYENLVLTTFCSGYGRSWAERCTSVTGDRGAHVETVSLWVAIDPTSFRPVALDHRFHDVWGETAAGRKVGPRLQIARPGEGAESRGRWPIRVADIDPYRHTNNAAQWAAMEELLGLDADRRGRAEVEFVAPIEVGHDVELLATPVGRAGVGAWLAQTAADGPPVVLTSLRFTPAESA